MNLFIVLCILYSLFLKCPKCCLTLHFLHRKSLRIHNLSFKTKDYYTIKEFESFKSICNVLLFHRKQQSTLTQTLQRTYGAQTVLCNSLLYDFQTGKVWLRLARSGPWPQVYSRASAHLKLKISDLRKLSYQTRTRPRKLSDQGL